MTATVLPSWLHLTNGVLSGTPLEADSGDRLNPIVHAPVTLVLKDAQGRSVTQSFTINVHWVNDPPVLTGGPVDLTADPQGGDLYVDAGAWLQDPDGNDPHQWSIAGVSNSAIFSSVRVDFDGLFRFSFAPYASGASQVTVQVSDASGATASKVVNITLPAVTPLVTPGGSTTLNAATGLYEQTATLTNNSAKAIGGFVLSISGLPSGVILYNGSSSGNGVGTVAYYQPVPAGQSVTLTLQYYVPGSGAAPSPVLSTAAALPVANPPVLAVDRTLRQSDGTFLLEFPSTAGRKYQILYSDDFAVWKTCSYALRAAGTRVQWTDRGAPWTDAAPAGSSHRFYRVQSLDN